MAARLLALRDFRLAGECVSAGEVVDVADVFLAADLLNSNKAAPADDRTRARVGNRLTWSEPPPEAIGAHAWMRRGR